MMTAKQMIFVTAYLGMVFFAAFTAMAMIVGPMP